MRSAMEQNKDAVMIEEEISVLDRLVRKGRPL
jgi:hypothetical protein